MPDSPRAARATKRHQTKETAKAASRTATDATAETSPTPASTELIHRKPHSVSESTPSGSANATKAPAPDPAAPHQPSLLEKFVNTTFWFMSERMRTMIVRGITTLIMFAIFGVVLRAGPLGVIILMLALQTIAFKEVVAIGYVWAKEKKLPGFRMLNWYFLGVALFLIYGEKVALFFQDKPAFAHVGWVLHTFRFYGFFLYILGFAGFVMLLRKATLRYQMGQFAWTHMTLLMVIAPVHFIIGNVFQGLFWFLLPSSLIICNDIMAYVFGIAFGKTPLIALSPKKTWEGFIGGALSTLLWGFFFAGFLAQFPYMICPRAESTCEPEPFFRKAAYEIPSYVAPVLKALLFDVSGNTISVVPAQLHALALASFASLLAPFGGFFASGVKRAFKLKDFGDVIPGHGGVTDRIDCQFMMGVFTNIYFTTFVKTSNFNVEDLIGVILAMSPDERSRICKSVCRPGA